jgi:hypothetical protein
MCQEKAMIRAGVACGGRFVVKAVRNLWVVDVVLGNKICTGMRGEETREIIRGLEL